MKIVIIDDQKRQINYLEEVLATHVPEIQIIATFQNPVKALKFVKTEKIDLIFLDIEMPEMTGFEFIEIVGLEVIPPVIFTTAYSKYAVEAFKVNAIDYLLKPVVPADLINAVQKVSKNAVTNAALESIIQTPPASFSNRIVLTEGQTYSFVTFDEIIRIQGDGSYAVFHLVNGKKIMTSKRLNVHWKRLSNNGFIRPHQSHVVNIKHIMSYSKKDGGMLIMQDDSQVTISTKMKEEVKQLLGI